MDDLKSKELKKKKGFNINSNFILLIVVAVLVLVFSLTSDIFMTYYNIMSMLRNLVIAGVLALGLTPLMIARGLDLSFGSSLSLATVVFALLYNNGVNIYLIFFIVLLLTCAAGFINGFLIEKFDLVPLILTLGTLAIYKALALVLSAAKPISAMTDELYYVSFRYFLKIPIPLWFFVVVVIIFYFILTYTKVGRTVYLIGANPKSADLAGIKVKKVRMLLYTFMGLMVGFASILTVGYVGTGNPYHGDSIMLPTLSAVVLGGISLAGGAGSVWGTLLGVLIFSVIFNGLSLLNTPSTLIQILQGLTLIIIVATYEIRAKRNAT